jgi:hypothetical protein
MPRPGSARTLADLKAARVESLDGDAVAYGHEHLIEVVKAFCDRWEIGVEHLVTDGHEIAQRLADSVRAYVAADMAATGGLDGIFQSPTGPDPGAM